MDAFLEVLAGANPGRRYPPNKPDVVIGRRDLHPPAPDIEINEYAVSRRHARLLREGQGFSLEDLESRNHTWVNGEAKSGSASG